MTDLEKIKVEIREDKCPYFDDSEIQYYLDKNNGDIEATIYELLTVKAEDSTISVSGLNTADTSSYFRRLASKHRQFNSGILGD
jgi:hypothetical protein